MADIVERLRDSDTTRRIGESYADVHDRRQADRDEAADAITRLYAENEKLNKSRNKWGQKYNELLEQHKVTVSQLRAAVWSDSEECKLLTAENERLLDVLSGVLWMADEWFNHGGDETAFSDDHAAKLEAARAALTQETRDE